MRLTRTKITRLVVAAVLVIPTLVVSLTTATAAPSKEDVEQAEARLTVLEHDLERSIEEYNEARYRLEQVRAKLSDAKSRMDEAKAQAAESRAALSNRAVEAYTGMGSQLDVLLEAEDFSEFSDRLTFMGAIAQSDAEVAASADADRQKAEWAANEYAGAMAERQAQLDTMRTKREQIQGMFDEQEQIAADLGREYADYLAQQRAAAAAAATTEADIGSDDGGGYDAGATFTPPPASGAAGTAVAAAYTKIGAPYVWGSAGPDTFDCSGFTVWAWAQAGVSLPHSALAQYSTLPAVSLSAVEPGDLIYYGNYGPHVAIYVGGGNIIHTRNPSPGGSVQLDSMYGYDQPYGAVRPG